jgi:hypothetical protein
MPINIKLAEDAKPQVALLLIATVITIILWFLPYAEYIVYPIRLFVTFIHEAAHALAAVLTGGSVHSLTISPDGSGSVYSAPSGWLGLLVTASAGYLGTTLFGVGLLVLIRRAFSPNKILIGLGAFVALITILFGVVSPLFNFLSLQVSFGSVAFTVLSGVVMSAGLLAAGRFLTVNGAQFAVAFLAVQCLLNALSDLKTLFMINAPLVGSNIQTDAANMAAATGLPAIVWVMIWLVISVVMIGLGLRIYAAGKIFASGRSNL